MEHNVNLHCQRMGWFLLTSFLMKWENPECACRLIFTVDSPLSSHVDVEWNVYGGRPLQSFAASSGSQSVGVQEWGLTDLMTTWLHFLAFGFKNCSRGLLFWIKTWNETMAAPSDILLVGFWNLLCRNKYLIGACFSRIIYFSYKLRLRIPGNLYATIVGFLFISASRY